jgi:ABC-type uncharacterized transport system permease subunit
MSDTVAVQSQPGVTAVVEPPPVGKGGARGRSRTVGAARDLLIRSLVPVVLALVAGGVLLAILGRDPFTFYSNVWQGGIQQGSWEDSAMRAAPLLLIGVGLTLIFRANIWNLGYDGQFLVGAALITGLAPSLESTPNVVSLVVLFLVAMAAGALWTIIPAFLKARYETNEIITTLMMSFIGVGVANVLVKGPFQDPSVNIPQTRVIPLDHMLPPIPGTRIHVGVLVALAAALLAAFVLKRTAFGLRLHVLGANPRAAAHVGINVKRLIVTAFLVSAVLSNGGDLAASNAGLSTDFLLVLVALILLFMTVIEFVGRRRDLGGSYLTPGLKRALKAPLIRRKNTQQAAR